MPSAPLIPGGQALPALLATAVVAAVPANINQQHAHSAGTASAGRAAGAVLAVLAFRGALRVLGG